MIECAEAFVLRRGFLRPVFRFMLQILFEAELLSDEGVLAWAARRRCRPAEHHPDQQDDDDAAGGEQGCLSYAMRQALFDEPKVQEFVAWVQQDEEDEEEDEEGSEEEDEEGSEEEEG